MNYNIISTGSKGNALVINKKILIDCGVTIAKLKDFYKSFQLVLLTHIHSDHFNKYTIKKLAQLRPTLRFGCCEWLVEELVNCGVNKKNIDVLKIGKWYEYYDFTVSPVILYHNVEQCGYRLYIDHQKIFYATDTNSLDGIYAKNYDYYFVEANYEEEEIKERIKAKEMLGIYSYEKDVIKNHLSKQKCDEFLYENMGENSKYIYMHQHEERDELLNE